MTIPERVQTAARNHIIGMNELRKSIGLPLYSPEMDQKLYDIQCWTIMAIESHAEMLAEIFETAKAEFTCQRCKRVLPKTHEGRFSWICDSCEAQADDPSDVL